MVEYSLYGGLYFTHFCPHPGTCVQQIIIYFNADMIPSLLKIEQKVHTVKD